jgi:hexokinase
VEPVAVINDTVAVLLAAAYKQPDTYIGSIYATGHNTCYLEPELPGAGPMVINLESGGFSKLLPNRFDNALDEASEKPGEQRLEKMVSGRYMGELFGLAAAALMGLATKPVFTSIDMSAMLADTEPEYQATAGLLQEKTGRQLSAADCALLRDLAAAIVIRSARLVTATYAGILWHLAGKGSMPKNHIAIDGSVYEKMPLAKENVQKALYDILGEDAAQVDTVLECGGSGLGAAIAAAMPRA